MIERTDPPAAESVCSRCGGVYPDDPLHPGYADLHPCSPHSAETREGVWVAYHYDWSGFSVFADELSALRHAVSNSMTVGFAFFGADLGGGRYPLAIDGSSDG